MKSSSFPGSSPTRVGEDPGNDIEAELWSSRKFQVVLLSYRKFKLL